MAGPLSPTTTFSKVKTPNDIQIPNSSVFENLGVGTRQGLQETTLAYAKEINLLQRAKNGQDDTIDFDEWNETNPYYREVTYKMNLLCKKKQMQLVNVQLV